MNSSGYTLATKIPWTPCIRRTEWIKYIKSELKVRIFEANTNRDLSGSKRNLPAKPCNVKLNSDKVLFSFAGGRERCDRNGHAVFLRPRVDLATTGSEITGISTSSTKLK